MRLLILSAMTTAVFPYARAQAQAADVLKGETISFDVISVKPNHSGGKPGNIHPLPNGIRMENIPLNLMVRQAYGLADNRLIVGGPQWMSTESFDVDARLTGSNLERLDKIPSDRRTRVMLQLILADRFKLAVHRETQRLAVYDLVPVKKGTKLKALQGNGGDQRAPYLSTGAGRISMHRLPMASFASALTRQTERTVEDKTGLIGDFDIELQWAPEISADLNNPGATPAGDSSVPGLFAALQEQLGLRLESGKAPVECVVIDHIERPADN